MTDSSQHPLCSIGSDPVSEATPCGENIRYDSEFEQLEAELAKQESLSSETVDWQVVADLSSAILKNSSKDLLVGAYLCNALMIREGYAGLAVGLKILADMANEHWDGLFPPAKRMRARQSAFTWLAEKAGILVSSSLPTQADAQSVIEAADNLKLLDGVLVEKMGDQAPMLTDLSTPLKNYRRDAEANLQKQEAAAPAPAAAPEATADTVTEEAPEASIPAAEAPQAAPPPPPPPAAKPAARANKAAPASAEPVSLESDNDSKKALKGLQPAMRDIAAFWLTQKLSDVRAYRLARQGVWMMIENTPPDNDGTTQINPPAPERLKYFETQLGKGEPASLVPELEKTLARSPFWIDGHFLVVKALRELGAEFEPAAKTVIRELRSFLERLPDVASLSFSDGTGFADDQTRMWITSEVLLAGDEGNASAAGDSGADDEPWNAALSDARKVAAKGEAEQALSLMNEGLNSAAQMRDQVCWRCAIAELLLQIGKADAAGTLLESLCEQLVQRQMEDWEPRLMAKVYSLLYQSYQKQRKSKKDDKQLAEKSEQAFAQLCWFDPVTALSVKGG